MNGGESREMGVLPPWWGLWWLIVFVVAIFLIIWLLYNFWPKKPVETGTSTGAPTQAVAECDRQLASSSFRVDPWTAHERFLTDYPVPTSKRPLYVYVAFKKSPYSSVGSVQQVASPNSVRINVHRPSDLNHQANLRADAVCTFAKQNSPADSSGYSEERWSTFCDLTGYQSDEQEQDTGLMKYRVRVENASDETVDYCFVASCDVRYPAGKPCSAPAGGGSPYSPAGPSGYPSGYSAPTASAPSATSTGQ